MVGVELKEKRAEEVDFMRCLKWSNSRLNTGKKLKFSLKKNTNPRLKIKILEAWGSNNNSRYL